MLRKRLSLLVTATVAIVAIPTWAVLAAPQAAQKPADDDDEKASEAANKWMQIKLHSSQQILAALARGDSKDIETNARRMLVLNVLEQWKMKKNYVDHSDYDAQLNAFEYATKELARSGRANDINGALEAYNLLTKSCVKCHQVIRDADVKK
jgi:hypothetical protein